MTRAFLSLGSNLGDRIENLRAATEALDSGPRLSVSSSSKTYETEPVEVGAGHPDYLNRVVEVECDLPPVELLRYCQGVEATMGRRGKGEMSPRTIDIDILLYGEAVVDGRDLKVPHPGINRAFNLRCLADIEPDLVVPGARSSVGASLSGLDLRGVWVYGVSLR